MDFDFVSVHKHAKKEQGQYPAILTSHLVNNPYLLVVWGLNQLDNVLDSLNNWGEEKERYLILKLQVEQRPFTKHSSTESNSFQESEYEISSSF